MLWLSIFDVVVTGGGALQWIRDIDRWAQQHAADVRPGGRVIVEDEHPVTSVLAVSNGELRVIESYIHGVARLNDWGHDGDTSMTMAEERSTATKSRGRWVTL